jgi:hypothetical protein
MVNFILVSTKTPKGKNAIPRLLAIANILGIELIH